MARRANPPETERPDCRSRPLNRATIVITCSSRGVVADVAIAHSSDRTRVAYYIDSRLPPSHYCPFLAYCVVLELEELSIPLWRSHRTGIPAQMNFILGSLRRLLSASSILGFWGPPQCLPLVDIGLLGFVLFHTRVPNPITCSPRRGWCATASTLS